MNFVDRCPTANSTKIATALDRHCPRVSALRRAIYPFFAPLVDQALQKHDP